MSSVVSESLDKSLVSTSDGSGGCGRSGLIFFIVELPSFFREKRHPFQLFMIDRQRCVG